MCWLFSFDQNWRFSPDPEWLNSPDSNIGMTFIILTKIETSSLTLDILFTVTYAVLSLFFSIKAYRTNSNVPAEQKKSLQWIHNCLC